MSDAKDMNIYDIRHHKKTRILDNLNDNINNFKNTAEKIAEDLNTVEEQRQKLMNEIEDLVSRQFLDKRESHRLMDKLARPYAMKLYTL